MQFQQRHGMCNARIYSIWRGMKKRCLYTKHNRYKYYGAKGITVCDKWLDFKGFLEDMGEPPTNKHTLDRVDNKGNYCKENCRWVTYAEQNRNYSANRLITYHGETLCVRDWDKRVGGKDGCVFSRLRLGWSTDKAVSTPARKWKNIL